MIKKILVTIPILTLLLFAAACGNEASGDGDAAADVPKIEKNIDAVAAELGLENKQEKSPEMIEASDGAGFDGGVELYLYEDTSSDAYRDITGDGYDMMGISTIKAAAANDGMILVFSNGEEGDPSLIEAFEALRFE